MPAREDMSSLLRVQWPAEILAEQGADVEITTEAWMIKERNRQVLDVKAPDADAIILCRPQHENVAKSIPLLQAAGIAVVVDFDDDLTAVHYQNHARAAFDPKTNEQSNYRWAKLAAEHADLVTVSTPALLDVYAKHGRGLVVPNRIPSWRLVDNFPTHDGPPRLGWAGFLGTHPTDLQQMGGAAAIALKGKQSFRVVGPWDDRLPRILGCDVEATGRVESDRWTTTIAEMIDVGVSPNDQTSFNAGKSCLKTLEYAAAGVAVVASPIPDNLRAHKDGLCALALNRRQWATTLKLFMNNEDARLTQAWTAREVVEKNHLLEPNVGEWWDAWTLAVLRHAERFAPKSYSSPMASSDTAGIVDG